jgi:hypothetical protein
VNDDIGSEYRSNDLNRSCLGKETKRSKVWVETDRVVELNKSGCAHHHRQSRKAELLACLCHDFSKRGSNHIQFMLLH